MAADVHDIAIVKLNGIDYRTKEGATLETGGFSRTSQYASGVRTGSSRKPMASRCTVTFEHMSDTDVDAIKNFAGDIDYITSTGQIYRAPNSQIMEPPRIQDQGNGIECVFEGEEAVIAS